MNKSQLRHTAISGLVLAVVGCNQAAPVAVSDAKTRTVEAAQFVRDVPSKDDRFLAIAAELRNGEYRVVSDWDRAISSCAYVGLPLILSNAAAETAHGMKIYQAWAKSAGAYFRAANEEQPVGQVIVKESWTPKEVAEVALDSRFAVSDGKYYTPDKPKELFIMFKDDPATSDTDEGWLYGIVAPDGKEVISSGHIKACADCHRQARHDRVFGPKPVAE